MPKTGDFILVSFVDQHEIGESFERRRESWFLHITLVPWFEMNNQSGLEQKLGKMASDYSAFVVRVGKKELFGPHKDIPVNVINNQAELRMLHKTLYARVISEGGVLPQAPWVGDHYNGHITRHSNEACENGDSVTIDSFYLVELQENNMCKIVKRFQLKDEI